MIVNRIRQKSLAMDRKLLFPFICSCDVCGFMCDHIEFLFDDKKASRLPSLTQGYQPHININLFNKQILQGSLY